MILRLETLLILGLISVANPFRVRRYDIPDESPDDGASPATLKQPVSGPVSTQQTGNATRPLPQHGPPTPSGSPASNTGYSEPRQGGQAPSGNQGTSDKVTGSGPSSGQQPNYGRPDLEQRIPPREYDSGHYNSNRNYDDGQYNPNRNYDNGQYNPNPYIDNGQYNPNPYIDNGQVQQGRDPMAMLMMAVPGTPGQEYPIYDVVPNTGFSCGDHQYPGLYADVNARCQVFHVCSAEGKLDSFLCPNGTIFHQEIFTCDWWYNVDCNQSPKFYAMNKEAFKASLPSQYGATAGQWSKGPPSNGRPQRPVDLGVRSPQSIQGGQQPAGGSSPPYVAIGRGVIGENGQQGIPWTDGRTPVSSPQQPPYPMNQPPSPPSSVPSGQGAPDVRPDSAYPQGQSSSQQTPNVQPPYPSQGQSGQPQQPQPQQQQSQPPYPNQGQSGQPQQPQPQQQQSQPQPPYPNQQPDQVPSGQPQSYPSVDQSAAASSQPPSNETIVGEASTGQRPDAGQKPSVPVGAANQGRPPPPPYPNQEQRPNAQPSYPDQAYNQNPSGQPAAFPNLVPVEPSAANQRPSFYPVSDRGDSPSGANGQTPIGSQPPPYPNHFPPQTQSGPPPYPQGPAESERRRNPADSLTPANNDGQTAVPNGRPSTDRTPLDVDDQTKSSTTTSASGNSNCQPEDAGSYGVGPVQKPRGLEPRNQVNDFNPPTSSESPISTDLNIVQQTPAASITSTGRTMETPDVPQNPATMTTATVITSTVESVTSSDASSELPAEQTAISLTTSDAPGGQPSTTTTTDVPQLDMRNLSSNEIADKSDVSTSTSSKPEDSSASSTIGAADIDEPTSSTPVTTKTSSASLSKSEDMKEEEPIGY